MMHLRNRKLIRKIASLSVIASMGAACLTGCGSTSGSAAGASGNGSADEINLMIWDGGYPDGIFDEFEKETGIHCNISYIVNTDEILAKLLAGGSDADYDFIDLESAYVKPFVDNGLLQKLDKSQIPNEERIDDSFKCPPGDEKNEYTCSNGTMGYTYIVYNKDTCPIKIDSFQDLADPKLKGQICSVNSTISLFGEALKSLGYEPDSTTESEYVEATDLWKKIKKNVKVFTGASCYDKLLNGECSVGFMFDYAQLEMYADDPSQFVVAKIPEGYESYSSTWAVPKSSKKAKEAEQLMNFLLSDNSLVERENYYPSRIGVDGILDKCDDKIKSNPAFNLDQEIYDNVWMVPVSDKQISLMDKYLTQFMS